MFSKYIKYTKGTIGFSPKSPFSFCKSSSKLETFAILNDAIFPVTSWVEPPKFRFVTAWDTKESFPQPLFGGLIMIFLLTVCFNIFHFFIMVKRCVVQFCTDSNRTGRTMQIFPNDANLKLQFVKFVQVKIADFVEPFEHSVVCSSHFSSWCCTDDSGLTRSKLFGSIKTTHTVGRRRGFGSGRPNWERSWALQKLEVNRESTKSIYMKTFR